jgi:hypothetical protein
MALRWSWSFGDEDLTDLATMGWTNGGSQWLTLTSDADKVYSYTGSPTRYGWILDGYQFFVGEGYLEPPPAAVSGMASGWIATPWKSAVSTGYTSGRTMIKVTGASGEVIEIRTTTTGAMGLYVSNTFVETSPAADFTDWRYVSLRWDMSGADTAGSWSGQIFVDGSAVTALNTVVDAADTAVSMRIGPGPSRSRAASPPGDAYCSQIIVWDSLADAGETAYYVTRAEPTADGTNVGTWTPSTGSDDFAVVDSPFDAATYTQDASPSASDRCEVVTSSIATALGTTPGEVAGVTAHTYSEGETVTARAVVSVSGGSEANGSSTSISAGATTYAYATDTATYVSSDTIDVIYEVVTV